MAESTLSGTRDDLRSAVGYFLGYGRDSDNWSTSQAEDIDECLKTGVRLLTTTPSCRLASGLVVESYQWTWLTPVQGISVWGTQSPASGKTVTASTSSQNLTSSGSTFYASMIGKNIVAYTDDSSMTEVGTLGTISAINGSTVILTANSNYGAPTTYRWGIEADGAYRLPDDFGGLNGQQLTFQPDVADWSVEVVGEPQIRETYQIDTSTGRPCYAATRPSYTTGSAPQRWDLFLYPIPDQVYVLSVPYFRLIDALSASLPYPIGGMPYFETYKAACLAAAEKDINDEVNGVHWQHFIQRALPSAIEFDAKQHGPKNLGRSGSRTYPEIHPNNQNRNAYYNGVQT